MEVAGENAAVMLNDQVLVAGGGHGTAVGVARLQFIHDAVEESDGDAALVMHEPLVEDSDEEIAPLAVGDGQLSRCLFYILMILAAVVIFGVFFAYTLG